MKLGAVLFCGLVLSAIGDAARCPGVYRERPLKGLSKVKYTAGAVAGCAVASRAGVTNAYSPEDADEIEDPLASIYRPI